MARSGSTSRVIIKPAGKLRTKRASFFFANGHTSWFGQSISRIFFFSILGIGQTFVDTKYIPTIQGFHLKGCIRNSSSLRCKSITRPPVARKRCGSETVFRSFLTGEAMEQPGGVSRAPPRPRIRAASQLNWKIKKASHHEDKESQSSSESLLNYRYSPPGHPHTAAQDSPFHLTPAYPVSCAGAMISFMACRSKPGESQMSGRTGVSGQKSGAL